MTVGKEFKFSMGEHTAWNLGIGTSGGFKDPKFVHIGFYWNDKPFPTHDTTISVEYFMAGLEELGLLDAEACKKWRDSRNPPKESPSPDEVFRAWSSAYTWPKEEPTTTRGESSRDRRSFNNDHDVRNYFGNGD